MTEIDIHVLLNADDLTTQKYGETIINKDLKQCHLSFIFMGREPAESPRYYNCSI